MVPEFLFYFRVKDKVFLIFRIENYSHSTWPSVTKALIAYLKDLFKEMSGSCEILFLITQQPPLRGERAFGFGTLVSPEVAGIVASAFSQDSWLEGGFNSCITVEFGGTDLLQTLALEAGCDKIQTQRTLMRHWLSKFGNKYKFNLVPRLKYGFLTLNYIQETPLDKNSAELAGARFLVYGSAP